MSSIQGIQAAWPEGQLSQQQAADDAAYLMQAHKKKARALAHLYAQSGVDSRRTVIVNDDGAQRFYMPAHEDQLHGPTTSHRLNEYVQQAPILAAQSCTLALDSSGVAAGSVTHLVTVSCTGMVSPGVDHALIASLGLPETTQRTNVGFMGCHGAINGLRVADALARTSESNHVLLCCVELCSLHFQYQPERGGATANALFADGSAACVVSCNGSGKRIAGFTSKVFPGTSNDMSWVIGDHGFKMGLSASVPATLGKSVRGWIDPWLREHGLSVADIAHWAIHPGGPRIVESVVDGLGISSSIGEQARELSKGILREYGNMSSPTVMILLKSLFHLGLTGPVVALAFGPGLAGEACLFMPED